MDGNIGNDIINDTGSNGLDRYVIQSRKFMKVHPLPPNESIVIDSIVRVTTSTIDKRIISKEVHHIENGSIFKPANLLSCITPAVYVAKALGVVCFSIVRTNNRIQLITSPVASFYNLTLIIATILLSMFFSRIPFQHESYGSSLEIITDIVVLWTPNVKLMLYLILAQKQRIFVKHIHNLHSIDTKMEQSNILIPHQRNQRRMMIFLLIKTLIFLLMGTVRFGLSFTEEIDFIFSMIEAYILLIDYMMSIAECQFLFWMLAIRQRFHLLNSRIEQSSHEDHENLLLTQSLADIHAALVEIANRTTSLFSIQLLYSMTAYFLMILMWSYGVIVEVVLNIQCNALYNILHWLAILIGYIINTVIICKCSGSTCDEANVTRVYVTQALRKTSDVRIREELRNFSAQLLHQPLHVSAGGFFDINLNLFYSMVGAVTTYLIILVQFELARLNSGTSAICNSTSTTSQDEL